MLKTRKKNYVEHILQMDIRKKTELDKIEIKIKTNNNFMFKIRKTIFVGVKNWLKVI